MRILHTLHSAKLEGGGVVQAVLEICSALDKHGIESVVATLDLDSDEWESTSSNNRESKKAERSLPVIHRLGQRRSSYGYSKVFAQWLKRNISHYDAVIIHGIWQYHSIASSKIAREHNIPYLVFSHGMLDPWFSKAYPMKHLKKSIYWKLFENKVFKFANYSCFTCEDEKRLAHKSFKPFQTIPLVSGLGIKDPLQSLGVQSHLYKSSFPYLKENPYFLYLGRIHDKKGIDLILEAFCELSKNAEMNDNYQLVIAGPKDGVGYKELLEKNIRSFPDSIQQRIHFTGMVTGELKWSLLEHAKLMLLPSHQENFGIVVAEALALSVPVLISNQVNIWREIEQEKAGFVGDDNLRDTLDSWRKWLNTPQKEVLQKQARKCFTKHFESSITANRLKAVLTNLKSEK